MTEDRRSPRLDRGRNQPVTLAPDALRRLRDAHRDGVTMEELCRRFGLSWMTVRRLLREESDDAA
jgi:AraC-like DNA-binding protein